MAAAQELYKLFDSRDIPMVAPVTHQDASRGGYWALALEHKGAKFHRRGAEDAENRKGEASLA